jgi:hypothetical protein
MNLEDKESLLELVQEPGWPALLRLLDTLASAQEALVLKCDMDGEQDRSLVHKKLRAEGARRLQSALASFLKTLRTKQ